MQLNKRKGEKMHQNSRVIITSNHINVKERMHTVHGVANSQKKIQEQSKTKGLRKI